MTALGIEENLDHMAHKQKNFKMSIVILSNSQIDEKSRQTTQIEIIAEKMFEFLQPRVVKMSKYLGHSKVNLLQIQLLADINLICFAIFFSPFAWAFHESRLTQSVLFFMKK